MNTKLPAKKQLPGRVFLSKCKNRPYLASCPADIVNAEFYLDLKLQKKIMKLRIRNKSDRAITAMTILAHYLDRDGNVIGDENAHIVLRFTGIYCAAHETSLGSKTVVLPYQDIAGIEAYIISLSYEDGTNEEFPLEKYILSPPQDMLENHLSAKEYALVQKYYGKRCVFVPKILKNEMWLCACGAVCDDAFCTACSMKKRNAARLANMQKTHALTRSLKIRSYVTRAVPYIIAAVLLIGSVTVLQSYTKKYIHETLPAQRLATTRRYLVEHRYSEALGYSVIKNHAILYDEILDEAVAYYCDAGDYDSAAAYERCRETPDYEKIYRSAAEKFIDGTFSNCTEYALNTADEGLRNAVLQKMAEDSLAKGKHDDACAIALHMTGSDGAAYADALLYNRIAALLENSRYGEAVTYIGRLRDKSGVGSLCRGIEQELLADGQYESAFTIAEITGDTSVFKLAYPTATATMLRRYYDKFYPYMDAEKKMNLQALPIAAAGGNLIVVTPDGIAQDAQRGTLCENAVSVASGDNHVLVLQKDGTVRAFGDNSAGQCGCDGLSSVIAIAAHGNHSLILLGDGTVRAFGDNSAGQCNVSDWKNVIAIATGKQHSVALMENGTIASCGSNASGQCAIDGYSNVISIAAGDYATILLFRDGSVATEGNITLETFATREWTDIIRISAGNAHLVGLSAGGRILYAGKPEYELNASMDDWSRVRYIACGERSVYAIDAYGKIMSCGSDVPALKGNEWESLLG